VGELRLDPVLIGPPEVGKSTVSALLASTLEVEHHELDRLRQGFYEEIGFDMALNKKLYSEQGWAVMYAYWQVFAPHSVERFTQSCRGVLDTGGGSPVSTHPVLFSRIQRALAPFANVVLLMPDPDVERSMEILGTRTDPSEMLAINQRFMIETRCFEALATQVVYTGERSAEDVHDEVLAGLRGA
jgi:shikimate kinase